MKSILSILIVTVFLLFLYSESNCQNTPWKNMGIDLGYINSMEMDNSHPDTMYAATPYGVYKSVDCAENWFKTSLTDIAINSIKLFQGNPNILIANSDYIIFKSEDFGQTWKKIYTSERTIGAIAFDPSDNLSIWIGVQIPENKIYSDNMYHSKNGGKDWAAVSFGLVKEQNYLGNYYGDSHETKLEKVLYIHFDQSNDSVIYVSGKNDSYWLNGGIFVSRDKGKTWKNSKFDDCSTQNVLYITSTPNNYQSHIVFALVETSSKYLFKSSDYGLTWEKVTSKTLSITYDEKARNVMKINPLYPEDLLIGGDYNNLASVWIYKITEDRWYYLEGTPGSYPSDIIFNPNGTLLGFSRGGIYCNPKGSSFWIKKDKGMNEVKVNDILTYPSNPQRLMVNASDFLIKTNNTGNSWSFNSLEGSNTKQASFPFAFNNQETNTIFAQSGDKTTFYAPTTNLFNYLKSNDGGVNWTYQKLFTGNGMQGYYVYMWITDILCLPNNILIGVDGGDDTGVGLYRSTDGANSWGKVFSVGVSTIDCHPINKDILYLGTYRNIYKSSNGGKNWSSIKSSGSFPDYILDLEVDKNDQVIASTSSGLYKLLGDNNWKLVQGFPTIKTSKIVIDNIPSIPVYYVGTEDQGVFVSYDSGLTWGNFNKGIENLNITQLKINDSYPINLYAGTNDRGVWMITLHEKPTSSPILPLAGISFNIYPNPTSGLFQIPVFELIEDEYTVEVYNSSGVSVIKAIKHKNESKSQLDLTGYSQGIYLVRIQSGNQFYQLKIIKK